MVAEGPKTGRWGLAGCAQVASGRNLKFIHMTGLALAFTLLHVLLPFLTNQGLLPEPREVVLHFSINCQGLLVLQVDPHQESFC